MSGANFRSFFERMVGVREDFWLKDGNTISVCACLSANAESASRNGKMTRLASRAEKEVGRIVEEAGVRIRSRGAFMRSKGKKVTAVGVAEVEWSPEAEKALESHGLVEAK
jgi:hypothetical protein